MKKRWTSSLALLLGAALLCSCGAKTGSGESSTTKAGETSASTSGSKEKLKIALLTDVAGTQPFILDMIDGFKKGAEKYGFEGTVTECPDKASYELNARALVEEGYNFIIGGGWQSGDAIQKMATEFPDKADYAMIDAEVEAENIKCITFHEQEGAYLIGQLAGLVTKKESMTFGAVHVSESASSWKWRYGFMEGVKLSKPDAKFIFNYVGSFSDPAKAKEFAMQQAAQGCEFINSAAAGGDSGVFEAAKEKSFYTSGQDIDLTSDDNPWVLTCQLKNTDATVLYLLDKYFADDHKSWNTENEKIGIKEAAIGAVFVTEEGKAKRNPVFTDEILAKVKQTAEDIRSGKLDLSKIPTEEEYNKK